jgi:hypothetical protein
LTAFEGSKAISSDAYFDDGDGGSKTNDIYAHNTYFQIRRTIIVIIKNKSYTTNNKQTGGSSSSRANAGSNSSYQDSVVTVVESGKKVDKSSSPCF